MFENIFPLIRQGQAMQKCVIYHKMVVESICVWFSEKKNKWKFLRTMLLYLEGGDNYQCKKIHGFEVQNVGQTNQYLRGKGDELYIVKWMS